MNVFFEGEYSILDKAYIYYDLPENRDALLICFLQTDYQVYFPDSLVEKIQTLLPLYKKVYQIVDDQESLLIKEGEILLFSNTPPILSVCGGAYGGYLSKVMDSLTLCGVKLNLLMKYLY